MERADPVIGRVEVSTPDRRSVQKRYRRGRRAGKRSYQEEQGYTARVDDQVFNHHVHFPLHAIWFTSHLIMQKCPGA